ncbi:BlaI/MecI/CopY family transcriptional regulator [Archaeoglobus neptunius]|uniref:BlaI/MecI/CopY family transcriptional regulator n=1 Tax=Archaeoglobus neptunius TaxID=2798580 RepID=UPI00192800E5
MVREKRIEVDRISPFSPLEREIVQYIWENPGSGVSEISKGVSAPISSVAATLDRLVASGYALRKREKKDGRYRFLYYPTVSPKEAEKRVVEKILDTLMEKFGDLVIDYYHKKVLK